MHPSPPLAMLWQRLKHTGLVLVLSVLILGALATTSAIGCHGLVISGIAPGFVGLYQNN